MSDHVLVVGFIVWIIGALVILLAGEKDFRNAFIDVALAILVCPLWPLVEFLAWSNDRLPKAKRVSGAALARFVEASAYDTHAWTFTRSWHGVMVIRRGPRKGKATP